MAFVYIRVDALQKTAKVGSKQCVALIQHYTDAPHTALWREGAPVNGNAGLWKGTAIATFVNGRYPSHRHGNHAAFFIRHGSGGFWVMDQWLNDVTKPLVREHFIKAMGHLENGAFRNPSDNADAYSVIER